MALVGVSDRRSRMLRRVRARLERRSLPRIQMALIVTVTGCVGFFSAVGLLFVGVETIWLSYGVAVFIAYLAFLGCVWVWLSLARREFRMCEPDSLGIEEPVDFVLAFWMVHEVSDPKAFLGEPKAHVPLRRFERTVELARLSGFEVEPGPEVWFSRSVVCSAPVSAVGQEP